MENAIREAIKTDNGKLIYVMELQQGNKNKIQLYINSKNEIHFDSNRYNSFDSYAVFDIGEDAHKVAKEIFLTYLQAYVKTRLLELRQLELVLDELGLKEVIRKTIVDNSSMLLDTKNEIINASIEHTQKLIVKGVDAAKTAAEAKAVAVIDETVRPIARKKAKPEPTETED